MWDGWGEGGSSLLHFLSQKLYHVAESVEHRVVKADSFATCLLSWASIYWIPTMCSANYVLAPYSHSRVDGWTKDLLHIGKQFCCVGIFPAPPPKSEYWEMVRMGYLYLGKLSSGISCLRSLYRRSTYCRSCRIMPHCRTKASAGFAKM